MELLLTSFASFVRQTLVHDTNYTVTNTEMTLSMARSEVHRARLTSNLQLRRTSFRRSVSTEVARPAYFH